MPNHRNQLRRTCYPRIPMTMKVPMWLQCGVFIWGGVLNFTLGNMRLYLFEIAYAVWIAHIHHYVGSSIQWILSLPIAIVSAHVVLPDKSVRTLVRQVPPSKCTVCKYLHCTTVRGWDSNQDMARDLKSTKAALICTERLYNPCTVAPCKRAALMEAAKTREKCVCIIPQLWIEIVVYMLSPTCHSNYSPDHWLSARNKYLILKMPQTSLWNKEQSGMSEQV